MSFHYGNKDEQVLKNINFFHISYFFFDTLARKGAVFIARGGWYKSAAAGGGEERRWRLAVAADLEYQTVVLWIPMILHQANVIVLWQIPLLQTKAFNNINFKNKWRKNTSPDIVYLKQHMKNQTKWPYYTAKTGSHKKQSKHKHIDIIFILFIKPFQIKSYFS